MKIGIITMHKVLNYGSALQAYALQQKLFALGYDNELIDYQYPKPKKTRLTFRSLLFSVWVFFRNAIVGFPTYRKKKKFERFYRDNFILSKDCYTEDSITSHPPIYDIYVTGSDQVWNPKYTGNDPNFFLAFAPDDKIKISYASSFATRVIPEGKKDYYRKYLSRYDAISVRELTGVQLVRELVGKDATVCCDPTMLLTPKEWDKLASQSKLKIGYNYILVYVLTYMVGDIYPEINKIIDYVQKILGYRVIYLVGRKEDLMRPNSRLIKSCGPADFVYLFKNAEFVITSSFHGAAFSLIYNKPLFGIVNKEMPQDSRIQSLLEVMGAENSIQDFRVIPSSSSKEELLRLKGDISKIEVLRNSSLEFVMSVRNQYFRS